MLAEPPALLPHVRGYREEEAGAEREGRVQRRPSESLHCSYPLHQFFLFFSSRVYSGSSFCTLRCEFKNEAES